MKIIKLSLLFPILLMFLCSCQSSSEKTDNEFAQKFEGDWKLVRLIGKNGVDDSVVEKFPITINVEDTTFLFRQATQYGQATYRNWIFEDSILLLPYSNSLMQEDTLFFKVLTLDTKNLVLQRRDSSFTGFDTLYLERY
ncbi:hypothetical protein WAF17_12840 [Bernardetia sp. ABR2-2B]|uniref:hypothetical protein n=1 Tax=Bernardetia sp. ABR2-2B TaxID=3127472 RepID=UPI0030CB0A85